VRRHPGTYASGVGETVWEQLSKSYFRIPPAPNGAPGPVSTPQPRLPKPTEGQPIPGGQDVWISTPHNSIREVWTSPTQHHYVFRSPRDRARFDRIIRESNELFAALPDRRGNSELRLRLNQASRWYPRLILWIAIGVLALAIRRPRGARTLLAISVAALVVILLNALGLFADPRFVLPVAPAFVLLAAAALLGPRGTAAASPQDRAPR